MAFNTLSYARRLKQAGVPEGRAEAMADATRDLVISDFTTKGDVASVKNKLAALEQRIMAAIDAAGLRLAIRMGGLVAVGVAVLVGIIKL